MLGKIKNMTVAEILGWVATTVLIIASGVNGLGYYPTGPLMLAFGGLLWLAVAVMRKDWPLIITNAVMSVVGIGTIIYSLLR